MTKLYFFDTFAFFEIIEKNPKYFVYTQSPFVTSKLNLFELYYNLLREGREELALELLDKCYPYALDFNKDVLVYAAQFKLLHVKRKLSMADCIGYVMAKKFGIPFLTGDKEFASFENVEFVPRS
ncbi:MAG: PIN domain-containing protein [bacterium]|nr:PIN domain-containing protein [bacterium]